MSNVPISPEQRDAEADSKFAIGDRIAPEVLAKIASLPIRPIGGYEWECEECAYDWDTGIYRDRNGRECDHAGDLISRSAVLEAIGVPAA